MAELEKRLNELSSQFEGGQPAASVSAPTGASVASAASAASPPLPSKMSEKSDMYSFDHLFPSPSPTGDESNDASGWSATDLKDLDSPWPLATESELLLMAYREMFAHLYPFVPIPREMTSLELREQRPYLWKGVMVSACIFDATRQVRMGEQLLADIGKGSMVDGTRSLDMLQAVQLLIGW